MRPPPPPLELMEQPIRVRIFVTDVNSLAVLIAFDQPPETAQIKHRHRRPSSSHLDNLTTSAFASTEIMPYSSNRRRLSLLDHIIQLSNARFNPVQTSNPAHPVSPMSPAPLSSSTVSADENCVEYSPTWGVQLTDEDADTDENMNALPLRNRTLRMPSVDFGEVDADLTLPDDEPVFYNTWRSMGREPESAPITSYSPAGTSLVQPPSGRSDIFAVQSPPPPPPLFFYTSNDCPPNLLRPSWGSAIAPTSFVKEMSPTYSMAVAFRRCFESRLRDLRDEALDPNGEMDSSWRSSVGRGKFAVDDVTGLDDGRDELFLRSPRQVAFLKEEIDSMEKIISRLEAVVPPGR
ncbi:hypothetical protein BC829DRAFT_441641 [Chytridium lagenaria]|nr:hypothetical protein BC829DRAFT_441641 [Chytridium lagenaria]